MFSDEEIESALHALCSDGVEPEEETIISYHVALNPAPYAGLAIRQDDEEPQYFEVVGVVHAKDMPKLIAFLKQLRGTNGPN